MSLKRTSLTVTVTLKNGQNLEYAWLSDLPLGRAAARARSAVVRSMRRDKVVGRTRIVRLVVRAEDIAS